MIQLRRWELTIQHLEDAYMQASLLMVDFSNRNPNRWAMEPQDVALPQGTPTYNLADRTVGVAIAYIDTATGSTVTGRGIGAVDLAHLSAAPVRLPQAPPD